MSEENNMRLYRLALASFVLATISLITLFLMITICPPLFIQCSYITAPLAIIVGVIAHYVVSKSNGDQRAKRIARAGIILGVVVIFLIICFTLVF